MLWDAASKEEQEGVLSRLLGRMDTGLPVVDVGCGNGLILNGAALRLTTGKAVGIDLWVEHGGGGDYALLQKNAALEGVAAWQVEGGRVHARSLRTAALSWAKRVALSGDSRVLDMAMRTCEVAVSAPGAIHTHSRRSLM